MAVLTAFFTSSVVATPAVFVILPLPSVDKEPCVTLNFTTPLAATSAVVNVPLEKLKPSFKDTVWPEVLLFAVYAILVFLVKLVVKSLIAFVISPIFAAFVEVVPPLATLVITLLPASIPDVVTDGPPVKRNPVVFIDALPAVNVLPLTAPDVPSNVIRLVPEPTFTVLAAVTESNVRSFFVLTVIFLPSVGSCSITMLSPPFKSTVLPPDTLVAVPPLVEIFHAEPSLADVTALVIASFTTVVMLSAVTTPSAALLIVPSVFVDNVPFLTDT